MTKNEKKSFPKHNTHIHHQPPNLTKKKKESKKGFIMGIT
jgi:hypothetical protein